MAVAAGSDHKPAEILGFRDAQVPKRSKTMREDPSAAVGFAG